ncbi:MAG: pentapeptide repeat-containing protein [Ruminococcus sp.]|nr:pentapeptide repeat-containing protein [Ruminococcus sp.]
MNILIDLNRKPEDYRLKNCVVDEIEEISRDQFETFQYYPTARFGAITNNLHRLPEDTEDIRHCILLLDADGNDGFIVNPHGADYARYSAFIPNARQLYRLNQYPSLAEFNDRMNRMVDRFTSEAIQGHKKGSYVLDISDVESACGFETFDRDLFTEMMSERNEFIDVEENNGDLYLTINPAYITAIPRELSQKDLDVICAKHILWMNDAGGERANLSNCILRNLSLYGTDLSYCVCCSAVFENCDMHSTAFINSDFEKTQFLNCCMQDTYFERATLSDAVFEDCDISNSIINDCRLTNAVMRDCDLDKTNPTGCDLEGFRYVESDITESDSPGLSPIL